MKSRACGGCGSSGFVTLMTTNETGERLDRLAYLHCTKDTPPMPMASPEQVENGVAGGNLELSFYELWSEQVWKDLFGDEPTLEALQRLAQEGKLRLSKVIKSPSGIMRARIYDTSTAVWESVGDEACEGFPTLPKYLRVKGYPKTSAY